MLRKKILLVDDSPTALLMERMLLSRRYDVITAGDGEAGLAKARAERPDLVLMDAMMPRLDGYEATRRLRADGDVGRTPVIMVTTRGEPESVERGYAAGCSDYVTKPIDGMELLAKVKDLLGEGEAP
jgi:DNA-binding response OmpR family regulator